MTATKRDWGSMFTSLGLPVQGKTSKRTKGGTVDTYKLSENPYQAKMIQIFNTKKGLYISPDPSVDSMYGPYSVPELKNYIQGELLNDL